MSHTTMEPNAGKADARAAEAEKVEDIIEPQDDPEKAIAYRISETEISIEQKKEEDRIMSVSTTSLTLTTNVTH